MKKTLSILLVAAMLLSLLAAGSFSALATDTTYRSTATTAGTTKRFSFTLDDYDYVSFEYKLASEGKICVRIPSSGDVPYYGIYDFTATGGTYDGITCEELDDGYIKATMKLDELTKTNNAHNRDNVPASVKAVEIDNGTVTRKAASLILDNAVTMRFHFAAESTEGLQ